MWTSFEIQKVQEMYSKLKDEKIEDVLPPFLVDVVKAEGGMAYENLRYITYIEHCSICSNEHCSIFISYDAYI